MCALQSSLLRRVRETIIKEFISQFLLSLPNQHCRHHCRKRITNHSSAPMCVQSCMKVTRSTQNSNGNVNSFFTDSFSLVIFFCVMIKKGKKFAQEIFPANNAYIGKLSDLWSCLICKQKPESSLRRLNWPFIDFVPWFFFSLHNRSRALFYDY